MGIGSTNDLITSYSQPDSRGAPIDHVLIRKYFSFLRNGFFVEAGANDGLSQSNTALLEKQFEWKGLLIEPSPGLIDTCRSNRPNSIVEHSALVSFDYKLTTVRGDFRSGHLMSSIDGKRLKSRERDLIEVPAAPLSNVLEKHNIRKIDFVSLDTEGYELQVLEGIDFSRHSPNWILIEIYSHDFKRIVNLLHQHNYTLIANLSGYNLVDNPAWDGTHNDFLFQHSTQ
jgi:FkbM family methyltransferase